MLTDVLCGRVEGFREEGRWRVNAKSLASYCAIRGVSSAQRHSRKAYYDAMKEGMKDFGAHLAERIEHDAANSASENPSIE
jgi:hypothetical protein